MVASASGPVIYLCFSKHDIQVYNRKNLYQLHIGYATRTYIDVIMKTSVQLSLSEATFLTAEAYNTNHTGVLVSSIKTVILFNLTSFLTYKDSSKIVTSNTTNGENKKYFTGAPNKYLLQQKKNTISLRQTVSNNKLKPSLLKLYQRAFVV